MVFFSRNLSNCVIYTHMENKLLLVICAVIIISVIICIYTSLNLTWKFEKIEAQMNSVDERFADIVSQQETMLANTDVTNMLTERHAAASATTATRREAAGGSKSPIVSFD